MKRQIALVDCNNFYVSCERLFRPDLRNTPIVVLSNNDGCVVSRSNESKELGIKMGVPWFEIQERAEHDGILADRGVKAGRQHPGRATAESARAHDLREGHKAQSGVAGFDELVGLRDVFPDDPIRLEPIAQTQFGQSLRGRKPIRGQLGIGQCDLVESTGLEHLALRIHHPRLRAPQHELAHRIGEPAAFDTQTFLYKLGRGFVIRCEQDLERCAVFDLGIQPAG